MSGLNILQDLKTYFDTKKGTITSNLDITPVGLRKAAEDLEYVTKIEKKVISVFDQEEEDNFEALFEEEEEEDDFEEIYKMDLDEEEEEEYQNNPKYQRWHDQSVLNKIKSTTKNKKRKAPILNRYGSSEPEDDSDDSGESCGPEEYTGQQLKDMADDLDVLDDGTMQDFRNTTYGQRLFDGVVDQIAAQTGHQTKNSLAEEHVNAILNQGPEDVSLDKRKTAIRSKCYVCDIVHMCTYDYGEYHIGSHCAAVVERITNFTTLLWGDYDFDDIENHVNKIDRAHTALLEGHFNKKTRKI